MRQLILFTILLVFGFNLLAQPSMETILNEIEKNNTTLSEKAPMLKRLGTKQASTCKIRKQLSITFGAIRRELETAPISA
jgi:hypothetical protein